MYVFMYASRTRLVLLFLPWSLSLGMRLVCGLSLFLDAVSTRLRMPPAPAVLASVREGVHGRAHRSKHSRSWRHAQTRGQSVQEQRERPHTSLIPKDNDHGRNSNVSLVDVCVACISCMWGASDAPEVL